MATGLIPSPQHVTCGTLRMVVLVFDYTEKQRWSEEQSGVSLTTWSDVGRRWRAEARQGEGKQNAAINQTPAGTGGAEVLGSPLLLLQLIYFVTRQN
ncbi:unnamed protein product [Lota lota]